MANGIVTWRNQTRTIDHQASQTRQTIDHQAEQTRLTLAHQADQTRQTIANQADQARLTDARALRDAKRERLRASYAAVLEAAHQMNGLTGAGLKYMPHWTEDETEWRMAAQRQQAAPIIQAVQQHMIALTLETDAMAFNAAWLDYLDAFWKVWQMRGHNQRQADIFGDDDIEAEQTRMTAGLERLEGMAREQLGTLDRPFPAPDDGTTAEEGGRA